jgi:hypothetical protein
VINDFLGTRLVFYRNDRDCQIFWRGLVQ